MPPPPKLKDAIDRTVRAEWGRLLASLTGSLGDLQLAEDSLQDAVLSAVEHWGKRGIPDAPAAWLMVTARRKAIDRLRRMRNFAEKEPQIAYLMDLDRHREEVAEPDLIPDKRLEMIFTCCHPALEEKTRTALTLRTLGGLSTEEIARAFLDAPDAMRQRLTRAKRKIALAGIPYRVPDREDLQGRLSSVLEVVYLIFNEGYAATQGDSVTRADLSEEAIGLGRTLYALMPQENEAAGLLALMLLHDSRRAARTGAAGEMVALDTQDRTRWDRVRIADGVAILETVLPKGRVGPYQLQAAISAVHAQSPNWGDTDWPQIASLYAMLAAVQPTPVVRVNQAVALSYAVGPSAGLERLDAIAADGKLARYQPYHAARADILRRAGRPREASASYETAIALTRNGPERAYLERKLQAALVTP